MKTFLALFFVSILAFNLQAKTYHCHEKASGERINFSIVNDEIIFTDTEYFGYAQILIHHPFIYDQKDEKTLYFKYDWYYTAWYQLNFATNIASHQHGDQVNLQITFDDDDGAFAEKVPFSCSVY